MLVLRLELSVLVRVRWLLSLAESVTLSVGLPLSVAVFVLVAVVDWVVVEVAPEPSEAVALPVLPLPAWAHAELPAPSASSTAAAMMDRFMEVLKLWCDAARGRGEDTVRGRPFVGCVGITPKSNSQPTPLIGVLDHPVPARWVTKLSPAPRMGGVRAFDLPVNPKQRKPIRSSLSRRAWALALPRLAFAFATRDPILARQLSRANGYHTYRFDKALRAREQRQATLPRPARSRMTTSPRWYRMSLCDCSELAARLTADVGRPERSRLPPESMQTSLRRWASGDVQHPPREHLRRGMHRPASDVPSETFRQSDAVTKHSSPQRETLGQQVRKDFGFDPIGVPPTLRHRSKRRSLAACSDGDAEHSGAVQKVHPHVRLAERGREERDNAGPRKDDVSDRSTGGADELAGLELDVLDSLRNEQSVVLRQTAEDSVV